MNRFDSLITAWLDASHSHEMMFNLIGLPVSKKCKALWTILSRHWVKYIEMYLNINTLEGSKYKYF